MKFGIIGSQAAMFMSAFKQKRAYKGIRILYDG